VCAGEAASGPRNECSPPCATRMLSALHVVLLEMRSRSLTGYRCLLRGVDSHVHSRFRFATPLKTKAESAAALEE